MSKLSQLHPKAFKKIQTAFKALRKKNIYARPKALDIDNSGCQDVIFQASKDDPTLRGGVYWNNQHDFDNYPVIWLGFTVMGLPLEELGQKIINSIDHVSSEAELEVIAKKMWKANQEERERNAVQIATEANNALKEAGLQTAWNGCICNTIQILLDDDFPLEAARSCVCEKIWQIEFARQTEEKLGQT
jgi:hypothetical protein